MTLSYGRWEFKDSQDDKKIEKFLTNLRKELKSYGWVRTSGVPVSEEPFGVHLTNKKDKRYIGGFLGFYSDKTGDYCLFEAMKKDHPAQVCVATC